jgi:hypothetical protein
MSNPWPFDDPPNLAVITLKRILQGGQPIRYVTHDHDDGGWQFLDGGDIEEEDAMVVGLGTIVRFDPAVAELADLPLGWCAWRNAAGEPWQRREQ